MQSCKKENEEITPEPEPIVGEFVSPNIVDESTRASIKTLDTTNFTFTFNAETEMTKKLKIGSVLVDSSSDLAPYGYLRKVTAISSSKGETVVSTKQAFLTDIAESGKIRFNSGRISQAKVKNIVLADGVTLAAQKDPNFSVFAFDYHKSMVGSNGEFTIDGHTSLDMEFFFNFDWHWEWELDRTLGHPVVELFESGVEVQQLASIHTMATGQYNLSNEHFKLADFYFTPWTFMVGPVPVVFYPRIELFLEVNGDITAEFTAGTSEEFTARMGVKYTSEDGWGEIAEHTYNTDFSAPNMNYAINFDAHIGPEISLLLYGVAGPFANITACTDLKSELEGVNQLWTLDFVVGVQSEVGVKIDVLGFSDDYAVDFCLFQDTLLHYENEPFGNAIYIDQPTNGSEFAIGDQVQFKCSYTGTTPDVVQFFIGPDLVYEDTEAPYEYAWESQGLNEGRYVLTVKEIKDNIEMSQDDAEFFLRVIQWFEIDMNSYGITDNTRCTDVVFYSSDEAWMTTSEAGTGKLLKTNNGGLSWEVAVESNLGLEQLHMFNSGGQGIFLTSTHKVYYTNDGGTNFQEMEYGNEYYTQPTFQWKNIFGISMNLDGEVVAVGKDTGIPYQFEIYRANSASHEPINDYEISHDNEYGYSPKLYLRGNDAIVYGIQDENQADKLFYLTSVDGGLSWVDHEFVGLNESDMLLNASILNETEWWIVGENAAGHALVLNTKNAGNSWQTIELEEVPGFSSVHFVDANKGYATVNKTTSTPEPKVYQTTDGGVNWQPVFGINSTFGMEKVSFLGNELGVVVGQGPVIYKYGIQ